MVIPHSCLEAVPWPARHHLLGDQHRAIPVRHLLGSLLQFISPRRAEAKEGIKETVALASRFITRCATTYSPTDLGGKMYPPKTEVKPFPSSPDSSLPLGSPLELQGSQPQERQSCICTPIGLLGHSFCCCWRGLLWCDEHFLSRNSLLTAQDSFTSATFDGSSICGMSANRRSGARGMTDQGRA